MKQGFKFCFITALMLSWGARMLAQSPLQTAKSEGALVLDKGKFVQVNLAQSAFTIAFNRSNFPSVGAQRQHGDVAYGAQLSFKPATNGQSATLYNLGQDDLSVGGSFTLTFGLNHLLSYIPSTVDLGPRNMQVTVLQQKADDEQKNIDKMVLGQEKVAAIEAHRTTSAALKQAINRELAAGPGSLDFDALYIRLGYRHDQYKLVKNVTSLGSITRNQIFDGLSANLAYNAQFGYKTPMPAVFAISVGEQTTNNSDDLTPVQVQTPLISGANGITTVKNTSALFGTYKQSSAMTFNLDMILKPKALDRQYRLGIDLLLRSDYATTKGRVNPGIAVFLSPPGKPLEVQGAVVVLYNNATKKAELNLVAGFNF